MHPFIYMMKFTTVCDSRYGVLDIQHNTLITVRTLSIKVLPRLLTDAAEQVEGIKLRHFYSLGFIIRDLLHA